jgi:hypothetical protein
MWSSLLNPALCRCFGFSGRLGFGFVTGLGDWLGGAAELERFGLNGFPHRAAAKALDANAKRCVLARWQRDVDLLQIGYKLPASDAGDLCAHAAEVFGLAPSFDTVADLDGFIADFALPSHRIDLETE